MQISRLFEILYILIEKKCVTATELSERFEVSTRTIYRDVDFLSMAGIPVYTTKGKGGGIHIMDQFVLNKALLSKQEQTDIIASLQGLKAIHGEEETTLRKLTSLFGQEQHRENWIEVDFTTWGSSIEEKDKFEQIKRAILDHYELEFMYFGAEKESSLRTVCPVKLIFKSQAWYLMAYCNIKKDFRVFKLNRIRELQLTSRSFTPFKETPKFKSEWAESTKREQLEVKIHKRMAFRMYDEFLGAEIQTIDASWYLVKTEIITGQWLINYMLSFEDGIIVQKPVWLREAIKDVLNRSANYYD